MQLQHASVPELRALVEQYRNGRNVQVSRATAMFTDNGRREFERWEPLPTDLPAWRIAAATLAGTEFIRQRTGQAAALQYVAIVDDAPWADVERSLGAPRGALLGLTSAIGAGASRIALPRAGAEQASAALDALTAPGATIASLTPDQRWGVQFLTSTTLHEGTHAVAYAAPRTEGVEGLGAARSSPFTESLVEAAADANGPAFLRELLGSDVGDLTRAERDGYGYGASQVEPSQRLAALADPADPAGVLLRAATTAPVGQQAYGLASAAAPGASPPAVHELAVAITDLAALRSQSTIDAFDSAVAAARRGAGATS